MGAHIAEHVGIAIRLAFIGLGLGAFSYMLTDTVEGWGYWAGACSGLGLYMLGAIIELAGERARKRIDGEGKS